MTDHNEATSTASWQRPPFEPGNEASISHGARSPRKVEALAKKVLNEELLDRYPQLHDFPETLTSLARVEAISRLMFADLATGIYDAKGQFKGSLIQRFLSAENTNAKLRASLGMTPASEAEVARDRAAAASSRVDVIAELRRQGQATRAFDATPGELHAPSLHKTPALELEPVTGNDDQKAEPK
jgi:hypothetical protein